MNQPLEPTENYINQLIEQGDQEFDHLSEDEVWDEFFEMVEEKAKPGNDIVATLTPEKAEMWHMGTGVCTEAGELLDAIKKHCIYNKKLDIENIVEEMGDLMFYFVGLLENIQDHHEPKINFRRILEANIMKLRKRYKKGYSDKEAQQRADKIIIHTEEIEGENQ
jgi:NTP pyrophosphatase (non-canonical NTP hydrolase)